MIRVSAAVMAHKRRAAFVPELAERLGLDDDRVVWDRKDDRWDTGRRAWEIFDPKATHHLVVQDDALVCRDLIPGLEKALRFVPAQAVVSPYVGTRRPMARKVEYAVNLAKIGGASWIITPGLNWGVGILAPTHLIPAMLAWCDKQTYPNYDRRIGRYFVDVMRWNTWNTWPSLVDHRDTPSLIGHGGDRFAHKFLGLNRSALDLDFNGSAVNISVKSSPLQVLRDSRRRRRGPGPLPRR